MQRCPVGVIAFNSGFIIAISLQVCPIHTITPNYSIVLNGTSEVGTTHLYNLIRPSLKGLAKYKYANEIVHS